MPLDITGRDESSGLPKLISGNDAVMLIDIPGTMAIAVPGTSSPDVEVGVPTSEDADVSMSGACSDVENVSAALDDDESSPVSSVPISSSVNEDEELVGLDERIAHVITIEELSCVSSSKERE